jgi:hypothetical protein
MASKLRPIVLLGLAGGIVAVVRKRSAQAKELAGRAMDAAPEPVKQAVDKVTGGEDDTGERQRTRRFAAPAEAGAQPPAEAGGPPSDDPGATRERNVVSAPDPALEATRAQDLPADAVVPDTSNDDPTVREAEDAAAADAGSIGGRKGDAENQP